MPRHLQARCIGRRSAWSATTARAMRTRLSPGWHSCRADEERQLRHPPSLAQRERGQWRDFIRGSRVPSVARPRRRPRRDGPSGGSEWQDCCRTSVSFRHRTRSMESRSLRAGHAPSASGSDRCWRGLRRVRIHRGGRGVFRVVSHENNFNSATGDARLVRFGRRGDTADSIVENHRNADHQQHRDDGVETMEVGAERRQFSPSFIPRYASARHHGYEPASV